MTGEVLTRMYDTVKGLLIIDEARKSTWEQLQAESDDLTNQIALHNIVTAEMDKKGDFAEQMKALVASLDKTYMSDVKNIVKKIKGSGNRIEQGQHTKDGEKAENTIEEVEGNNNYFIQG